MGAPTSLPSLRRRVGRSASASLGSHASGSATALDVGLVTGAKNLLMFTVVEIVYSSVTFFTGAEEGRTARFGMGRLVRCKRATRDSVRRC